MFANSEAITDTETDKTILDAHWLDEFSTKILDICLEHEPRK